MGLRDKITRPTTKIAGAGFDIGSLMAEAQRMAPLVSAMQKIEKTLQERGGTFSMGFTPERSNEWTVGMEWGSEAEDSPMAAAAAYGVDEDLYAAIQQMVDEAKI